MNETSLRAAAETVLRANDRGGFTVPSARLYPHQWNWDSAFIAIGWAHVDPRRAARELHMLLRGQWNDGFLPHILFNPAAASYEPGPATWGTDRASGRPADVHTTSITQPPVAATAARIVLERSGGDGAVQSMLRDVAVGLERWHRWFQDTRDPTGDGVPCIVHPWESGMDNAQRWDEAMKRIDPGVVAYKRKDDSLVDASQRPTRHDYDRYFFLVRERARLGFAPPRVETEPLLVQDVAMAAILCRAEADLAELCRLLGVESDAAERHARIARAIHRKLYDDRTATYHDFDVLAGTPVRVEHVATMLPLFAGIATPEAIDGCVAGLTDEHRYATRFPVPTVPIRDPGFEPRRYWRGPSWVNVNWMLVEGLRAAGRTTLADTLAAQTIALVAKRGFFEYFEPTTGEGLGASEFSWTAALVIDLLAKA